MKTNPAEVYVLDTSALLCLKEDEEGADEVDQLIRGSSSKNRVYISFMSYMEFFYILQQEQGESAARLAYAQLRQLPLRVMESDEELGLMAAGIKAEFRLCVADAWIAATAERLNAILVHKDPEFDPLQNRITLHQLPYKKRLSE